MRFETLKTLLDMEVITQGVTDTLNAMRQQIASVLSVNKVPSIFELLLTSNDFWINNHRINNWETMRRLTNKHFYFVNDTLYFSLDNPSRLQTSPIYKATPIPIKINSNQ